MNDKILEATFEWLLIITGVLSFVLVAGLMAFFAAEKTAEFVVAVGIVGLIVLTAYVLARLFGSVL